MNASVSVVCYKSKKLSNGLSPLMLQVSKDGKRKYKSLGISIHPKHWDFEKCKPIANCPNREYIQKIILDKQTELQKQILELNSEQREYTATTLLENKKIQVTTKTVREFYTYLISHYVEIGKIGNSKIYRDSFNSLKSFTKGKLNILFADIDVNWLNRYEKWLTSKKTKETTMSLLFRTLRSAYNKAIENKYARKELYPFDEFKISKFNTKTKKRAIDKKSVLKIIKKDLSNKRFYVQFAQEIFTFSYLCGGINFADIARLRAENIKNDRLHYIRQKTGKEISLPLQPQAKQIIDKYYKDRNNYLFPILDIQIHKTAIQIDNRIHKVLGKIDKCLKEVAILVGIDANLTTYVARHSYATTLKKSGVDISIISETMGHSDIKTTEIYLDSFDNEQIDKAMKNLL